MKHNFAYVFRYFSIDRRKEQILKESEDRWGKKLRQEKINHKADQEILETQIMREKDVLQQEIGNTPLFIL